MRVWSVLLLATVMITGCGRVPDGQVELIADIATDGQRLIVKNGDAFVWQDAEVVVNGEYVYRAELLPRGASALPFSAFVTEYGHRVLDSDARLRSVEIRVPDARDGVPGRYKW